MTLLMITFYHFHNVIIQKMFSKEIQTEWNIFMEIFVLSTVPDWFHSGVIVKPRIEGILAP